MRFRSVVLLSALVVLGSFTELSHPTGAQEDPCAGSTGAAYGLCTAYCVHLECATAQARPSRNARQGSGSTCPSTRSACQRIAANYTRLTGTPLTCTQPPQGGQRLACTCSAGFLSCSADGLEAGVPAFLNIDLTAYSYGFNGVEDGITDAQGRIQFEQFDLAAYLADKNLVLSSVVMHLTNVPGTSLAQTTVATCPR